MPITPIIEFKAGKIDLDESSRPYKSKPDATKGYVYLYQEDDMTHFCWRERSKDHAAPEIDLITFPDDAHFVEYKPKADKTSSKTSGRIVVLKFDSSPARHLFWLQSKPETDDKSKFSAHDYKIINIVDAILQGEDVDVKEEMALNAPRGSGGDGDETMEDVEGHGEPGAEGGGGGGAGADATGGDVREEGESSREGGADGARASAAGSTISQTKAVDPQEAVRNFLSSLNPQGQSGLAQPFTTLSDLLSQATLSSTISSAPESTLDKLLLELPPTILLLAQESSAQIDGMVEPTPAAAQAALEALSEGQKRATLKKVLLSPQFAQGMGSLESAIREGGLRDVAAALQLQVEGNGSEDPLKSFLEGIKRKVESEK